MPTNATSSATPSENPGPTGSAIHVSVEDARSDGESDPHIGQPLSALAEAVHRVFEGEGVMSGTASVILVDLSEMAELNEEHMGVSGPTDVLSFPLDSPAMALDLPAMALDPPAEAPHVGDILLCVEVAEAQAPSHCGSLEAELQLLSIHGALHLLGHDHAEADERLVMQSAEAKYLSAVGFDHPGDQL